MEHKSSAQLCIDNVITKLQERGYQVIPPAETFEASDGTIRRSYFGNGLQPLDIMKEEGWGPIYAACCVLKYMRRKKGCEDDDRTKAKWYLSWLQSMDGCGYGSEQVGIQLRMRLDPWEWEELTGEKEHDWRI